MAGRLKPPGHGTLYFPNSEDVRIEGWRVAVSLNWNPLTRVDEAEDRLRERQHCPWREEFFKLIAILTRQTLVSVNRSTTGQRAHICRSGKGYDEYD